MIHLFRVRMYICGRTIDGRIRDGGIPGWAPCDHDVGDNDDEEDDDI